MTSHQPFYLLDRLDGIDGIIEMGQQIAGKKSTTARKKTMLFEFT
jgi:hypothetical protein